MNCRVAIPVPTARDIAYNDANWSAYADGVLACGGEPVRFPLGLPRHQSLSLAASCNATLLPGSPADVDPGGYGHAREEACAPADFAREAVDDLLIEDARIHRKPLLAICYGMQILNVRHGGTLVQDLHVLPVNHAAGRSVAVAHSVSVSAGSLLASLVDRGEVGETERGGLRLPVNSSHHQAVGVPGRGLAVVGRSSQDGVIEALEMADAVGPFMLGVQWHPERTFTTSATSRAIFERFLSEARAVRPDAVGYAAV